MIIQHQYVPNHFFSYELIDFYRCHVIHRSMGFRITFIRKVWVLHYQIHYKRMCTSGSSTTTVGQWSRSVCVVITDLFVYTSLFSLYYTYIRIRELHVTNIHRIVYTSYFYPPFSKLSFTNVLVLLRTNICYVNVIDPVFLRIVFTCRYVTIRLR